MPSRVSRRVVGATIRLVRAAPAQVVPAIGESNFRRSAEFASPEMLVRFCLNEETASSAACGQRKQFLWTAGRCDSAVLHEDDAVGYFECKPHFMCDDDHRHSL